MITVNAMGDACPIPVVKTKHAIMELNGTGTVEIFVDNEIAVQSLTKMANQKQYGVKSEKLEEGKYRVVMSVGEAVNTEKKADSRRDTLVVISSKYMGAGDEELGRILMKGFIYTLTQQDELPKTMLFYNSGAYLTCEESPELEDLRSLEAQGVEILTCGTCMNHYGLQESLRVGSVTNMYSIVEKMMQAGRIVKP